MNIEWLIIWLILWFVVMGGPNFLFKKYKITYYQNPWQHIIFFTLSVVVACLVYKEHFIDYFTDLKVVISAGIILFLLWIVIPLFYKNDYFTKNERLGYQLPKFFEILFQQVTFLGGLLTFGVPAIVFGLIFFLIHLPNFFFVQKRIALFFILGSSLGGAIFSLLQSLGQTGFVFSLSVHLAFYLSFFYFYSPLKSSLGFSTHKR